ncbi:deoxyribose-phosphate aldolase [Echinicola sp. CAU 1574]|uniref:Deoxyribose-phosphate aldolase n=1 Tax=Echinicola arenosa TaxID=2774144 RepID=A0ABR9AMV8_9BACT|nr:deoxyribose-phosphate aldolase [Echinicola arenosa]MBD8489677.1 deoxyribose-phosphate aldolase [Echinicola arenosa]
MIDVRKYLEHTLLKPDLTDRDINALIEQAKVSQFVGVCVPPFWVKKVKRELQKEDIQVVTVVGFPLGYQMTETKVFETQQAIKNGADEIDVVWSLSAYKSRMNWPKIELAKLSSVCHEEGKILKVIIETALLSDEEKVEACKLCSDAGVDYVKTSTGFSTSGAQLEDIRLMRENLPSNVGIKASGGIKTLDQVLDFIQAGADRIGTSSSVDILKEMAERVEK